MGSGCDDGRGPAAVKDPPSSGPNLEKRPDLYAWQRTRPLFAFSRRRSRFQPPSRPTLSPDGSVLSRAILIPPRALSSSFARLRSACHLRRLHHRAEMRSLVALRDPAVVHDVHRAYRLRNRAPKRSRVFALLRSGDRLVPSVMTTTNPIDRNAIGVDCARSKPRRSPRIWRRSRRREYVMARLGGCRRCASLARCFDRTRRAGRRSPTGRRGRRSRLICARRDRSRDRRLRRLSASPSHCRGDDHAHSKGSGDVGRRQTRQSPEPHSGEKTRSLHSMGPL